MEGFALLDHSLLLYPILTPSLLFTAISRKVVGKSAREQSRKVLSVVLSSLFFKQISKNDAKGHRRLLVSAKGKLQKKFRQLQCQEQCIDHIPYYLSGLSRAHFSR